jgi:hypothetical protein
MKVIIAGSRDFADHRHFDYSLANCGLTITEVVCGECRGPDLMGKAWANQRGIPVKSFPADWSQHGRAAGPKRNAAMADYADAAVVFWDGTSRGTANMIGEMQRRGKRCIVVRYGFKPC